MNYTFGNDLDQSESSIFKVFQNSNPSNILKDVSNMPSTENLQRNITQKPIDILCSSVNSTSKPHYDEVIQEQRQKLKNEILQDTDCETKNNNPNNSSKSLNDENSEYNENGRPRRKPRTVFSRNQLGRMKEAFTTKPYLTTEERRNLANELGVSSEQVKVWFQNHRSKLKRQGRLMNTNLTDGNGGASAVGNPHNIHFGNLQNFSMNPQPSMGTGYNHYIRPAVGFSNEPHYEYLNQPIYQINDCFPNIPQFYQPNGAISQPNNNGLNNSNTFVSQPIMSSHAAIQPTSMMPNNNIQKSTAYPIDMNNYYKTFHDVQQNGRS